MSDALHEETKAYFPEGAQKHAPNFQVALINMQWSHVSKAAQHPF